MPVPTENPTPKRLKILSAEEIEVIYGRPCFSPEERMEYFALSPPEMAAMEQLHSIKSRIYFILQLGYFKARHLFFVFSLRDVEEDAKHIQVYYFPTFSLTEFDITKVTRLRQRQLILDLFNYRACDTEERYKLEMRARFAARVSSQPIYVFRELMNTFTEQRILALSYSSL